MLLPALMAVSILGAAEPAQGELRGSIGVCLRFRDDHKGVSDVVVVESTGSRELDRAMADGIKLMEWPVGDDYKGDWIGVRMLINPDGPPPPKALPDCSKVAAEHPKGA